MSARSLLYIAAALLLLFATGHTLGFLTFHPPTSAGQAAWSAMQTAQLQPGHSFTWARFYTGFGLFVTAFFLFAAFLALVLARHAEQAPRLVGVITAGLAATMGASLVLAAIFFSAPPVVFSALLLLCLVWAGAKLRHSA